MSPELSAQAYGFIIIHKPGGDGVFEPRFLLLRASNHGSWSPPKGLVEPDESGIDCALRECAEETGLSLRDLPAVMISTDSPVVCRYEAWGKPKVATYYTAVSAEELPVTLSDEHDAFSWVSLDEFDRMDIGKAKADIRRILSWAAAKCT